ncbi:MAG TPA: GAF domain-containing protein [Armatimonadota bacterium]
MALWCAELDDPDTVFQRLLSVIEAALPSSAPFLLFSDGVRIGGKCCQDLPARAEREALRTTTATLLSLKGVGQSFWVVPIMIESSRRAALVVCADALSDDDKTLLQAAAHTIILYLKSINNSHADSPATSKRVQEISAIYEISQAIDNFSIDELLKLITEKAADVMDAQACSLMLKVGEKDELVIKASYGLAPEIIEETRVAYGYGIAGTVAKTGRPMLVNNLNDDPRFRSSDVTARPGIVSSISVPLRNEEGGVQGVLSIRRASPAAMFNKDDLKVFSVFASQAALAISNAHLYRSIKSRVQELSTLYQAGRELSAASNLEEASQALVRIAANLAEGNSVMLLLWDGSRRVRIQAHHGVNDDLCRDAECVIDDSAVAWMKGLRDPHRWLLSNADRRPAAVKRLSSLLEKEFDWATLLPLVAEDTVVGVLILGAKKGGRLDQRRTRLLSILASQAAVVIKNARSHEEQMDRRVMEMSVLYDLSKRLAGATMLNDAWGVILDIVQDIVACDGSVICSVDPENETIAVQVCRGHGCEELGGREFSFADDGLIAWAVRERRAFISSDIKSDRRFGSSAIRCRHARSVMAIPFVLHDQVVGVLNVYGSSPGLFSEENVKVLSVIATQAAALYKEQEALNALSNYTDNILRSIAVGVATLDSDGNVLTWNRAAEELVGIPADAVVGRDFASVVRDIPISDAERDAMVVNIAGVMRTGDSYLGYKQEFHPVGMTSLFVDVSISLLRDQLGNAMGAVIILEDVTEQMRMEKEMHRVSDLAAIGQLAANIAHEIRNPLSSIKGAAQFMKGEDSDSAAVREFLDIIIEEVNVLNKITTEFLDYARPSNLSLTEVDINEVIQRTLQLLQPEIAKHGIDVVQHFGQRLPQIMADGRQLDQVFRNIILNAQQAMTDGGRLSVITRTSRRGVSVIVEDTGVGIPEDQIDQIFQPFFTTKTKGTGIGLAIVDKIVDKHGGDISVRSIPGRGTRFHVYLPPQNGVIDADAVLAKGESVSAEVDLFGRAQGS